MEECNHECCDCPIESTPRTEAEILSEMERFRRLVWYVRCASQIVGNPSEVKKTDKAILTEMVRQMRLMEEEHEPEMLMADERDLGRYEGWLAALRWVLGEDEPGLMDT